MLLASFIQPVLFTLYLVFFTCPVSCIIHLIVSCIPPPLSFTRPVLFTLYPVSFTSYIFTWPVSYYSHCILYPTSSTLYPACIIHTKSCIHHVHLLYLLPEPGLYPIIHIVSCIPPSISFTRPVLLTLDPISFTSYIFYLACIQLFTLYPVSFTWPVSYYSHCILYPSPPISLPGLYFESCILYSLTYLTPPTPISLSQTLMQLKQDLYYSHTLHTAQTEDCYII